MFAIEAFPDYIQHIEKLAKFRRHPDWRAAFRIVWAKNPDLLIELEDGCKGLPEANVQQMFELADQEFIENLIRRGY